MGEWKTVKLAEVLRYRKANILINNHEEYSLCRVQLHRRGVVLREKKIGSQIKTKKQQVCRAGDLVVAEMDAKFGGYGFIPDHLEGAIVSSHYYLYELDKNKITQEYFEILIKTDFIQNQIEAKGSTNYSSIRAWEFLDYEIPLQSIALQNIIAAKYLKHSRFKEDLGIELNAQLQYLSQLRQRILQEAIEGKLTTKWRDKHPELISGDNHASKLLEKIKAEKERLIKEGKIKKDKPLLPIADDEKPFDLPEGWVWCRYGEVISLISGQHIEASDCNSKEEGFPYITGPADFGDIYPNVSKWTTRPKVFSNKYQILITVKGSGVGKLNMNNRDGLVISRQLMAIQNLLNSNDYCFCWLKTLFISLQDSKDGLIPGIGRDTILLMYFPLPPLAEQQAIVDRVDKLMTMIGELEKQVSGRKDHAEMLMQSVLREAFAGNK